MLRAAAPGDERIALMVPVSELAGHCPALGETISLGPLDPAAYRELRDSLRPLAERPERVRQLLTRVRAKVPSLRADLRSVEAIVEAVVLETMTVDERETRYHLAGLLGLLEIDSASRWMAEHLSRGE